MDARELCRDDLGVWMMVFVPDERGMMFEYRLQGNGPKPILQMTIDQFLFILPRSASHQRAVDALIAILDAAIAGSGRGNSLS